MRNLAIDYGEKRLGLALSDPLGITAQPLEIIHRSTLEKDVKAIQTICDERQVGRIIIGIPVNMDGSPAVQHDNAAAFANTLKETLKIDVIHWDERLTSAEAERILLENNTSRKKRRQVLDKLAATLILQSWMDAQGGN